MQTRQYHRTFIGITFFLALFFFPGQPAHAIESSPSHLKYFGYLSNDYIHQTPTYFSELDSLGNTNIAWGRKNLNLFAEHHIRVLFPTGPSDWLTPNSLAAVKQEIDPYIGNIFGFYFDEPFWRGYSEADFVAATKTIHDTYPDKAILVLEAAPPFVSGSNGGSIIPPNYYQYVTDIGVDYYFVAESTDNDQGWNKYMNVFNHFIDYAAGKHVWLVPDGYGDPTTAATRWPDAWERYIQFARDHDIIIGLLGFIYDLPSELAKPGVISLRNLMLPGDANERPSFRWRQREVGMGIIANAPPIPTATPTPKPTPTPTPKPGDLNGDRKVDIFDYNLLVGNFGKTGAAGFSPADINKNGKVDIFDYNILVGNFGK